MGLITTAASKTTTQRVRASWSTPTNGFTTGNGNLAKPMGSENILQKTALVNYFCWLKKVYEGNWVNDQKSGIGKLIYVNGTVYEGEFFESKKSGFGKFTWPDRSHYEGSWIQDRIEGYGKYVYADGRIFKGKWVENNMMGYGELTWPNE
jgi:hypothetical protein